MNELPQSHIQSYVGPAFKEQHNVVSMFGAALLSAAFASWVPLAVGFVAELVWLFVAPRNAGFRSLVDRKAVEQRRAAVESAFTKTLDRLPSAYSARFEVLGRVSEEVLGLAREQAETGPVDITSVGSGLDRLRRTFVEFALVHERIGRLVQETPSAALSQEVARLSQAFAEEKDLGVRLTLRQSLMLAQRRERQREQLNGSRRSIELKLEMIEKSLLYLRSQIVDLGSGERLPAELEALLKDVGSAFEFEASLRETSSHSVVGPLPGYRRESIPDHG